jgi:hypothetical protein
MRRKREWEENGYQKKKNHKKSKKRGESKKNIKRQGGTYHQNNRGDIIKSAGLLVYETRR